MMGEHDTAGLRYVPDLMVAADHFTWLAAPTLRPETRPSAREVADRWPSLCIGPAKSMPRISGSRNRQQRQDAVLSRSWLPEARRQDMENSG